MKVVRLNENDIENLVRKIIKEEKTIKEGPVDWVRSKFNQDEDLALLIFKGIKSGNVRIAENQPSNPNSIPFWNMSIQFSLDGHNFMIHPTAHKSPEKRGKINLPRLNPFPLDNYVFKMGDQPLHVSESLKKDIYKFLLKLISEPQKKERFKDAKNLFSKYNLSDKERSKIEDTDSIFDNL